MLQLRKTPDNITSNDINRRNKITEITMQEIILKKE